ncbi:hypothetical protein [Ancylobacter sp. IITR112]|uniref:hypothetical protein n=1 Tax=Ancylobacter sp. IITR112 TaxID=3138073 RepID=UPI003529D5D6
MSDPKHGVAAVVSGVLRDAPAAEISGAGGGDQLDLLGNADAETPVGALVRKRSGAGRPVGAQNRVTRDIRRLLLSQFKHPLIALAEIYSTPTTELASHLGCKPEAALGVQVRAAAEVAPYLTAKQAAVDDKGAAVMPSLHLNFGVPASAPMAGDGRNTLSIEAIAKASQDQWLSAAMDDGSHDDGSHDEAQAIEDESESDD